MFPPVFGPTLGFESTLGEATEGEVVLAPWGKGDQKKRGWTKVLRKRTGEDSAKGHIQHVELLLMLGSDEVLWILTVVVSPDPPALLVLLVLIIFFPVAIAMTATVLVSISNVPPALHLHLT